jgi:uncharacterized membrane protein
MKRRLAIDSTSRTDDAISLYLVIAIACLATALLFIGLPTADALLTTEQISQMPLWGP